MTRWLPCPYMVKTFRIDWPMSLKLGIQHRSLEYYQICSNDDPRLTFDLFTQTLVPYAFVWENAKMVDYSETIEVYGIIIGIYSKPNEYMAIYIYQRSRLFFNLCPGHSDFINFKPLFTLKLLNRLQSNNMLNLRESRGPECMEAVEATWPRWLLCT